jgi:hypothetical protein
VKFLAEKESSMKWNYLELEHCGLSQLQLVRQAPWASVHRSVPYLEMARQEQGEESVVTASASVWSLTVLCIYGERERCVECKGRQSKNGGGYGSYVQRLLQDIYELVISDGGLAVLPSICSIASYGFALVM